MNRLGAWCGVAGFVGNVAGIAVLRHIPSAYRPGTMAPWVRETLAAPGEASASAIAFTLGLLALAAWAVIFGARLATPMARAAGITIAVGAILDAAFCPAPMVLALHLGPSCRTGTDCLPAGLALLGMSLTFDALFNLLFGLGLIVLGAIVYRREPMGRLSRTIGGVAILAGALTVPVALQVYSDAAARILTAAGPAWLAFVALTSAWLWRQNP